MNVILFFKTVAGMPLSFEKFVPHPVSDSHEDFDNKCEQSLRFSSECDT